MTQRDRVLRSLQNGPITAYDWATNPPDGQRIMRVHARILELRQQGHRIVADGKRDGHLLYRLENPVGDVVTPWFCPGCRHTFTERVLRCQVCDGPVFRLVARMPVAAQEAA